MTLRSKNKDKLVSVHQKILQLQAPEKFTSKLGVSPKSINDIFHIVERSYIPISSNALEREQDHNVYHGSGSVFPLSPNWGIFYESQ